jgi:hypothetical protein
MEHWGHCLASITALSCDWLYNEVVVAIGRISIETSESTKVQTEFYIIYLEFTELRCNIDKILRLAYVLNRPVYFNPNGLYMGRCGAWFGLESTRTAEGFAEMYIPIGPEKGCNIMRKVSLARTYMVIPGLSSASCWVIQKLQIFSLGIACVGHCWVEGLNSAVIFYFINWYSGGWIPILNHRSVFCYCMLQFMCQIVTFTKDVLIWYFYSR